MPDEVHRLVGGAGHHGNEVLDKPRDEIPIPVSRLPRLPGPPNVIPNDPKPRSKHTHDRVPNRSVVGIPVHKHERNAVEGPVLVDSKPNPTRLHPPTTHGVTVAANRRGNGMR
jgi:hypothetical protein